MASRRQLKKNVNYIAGELYYGVSDTQSVCTQTDLAKADDVMMEILKLQEEFVSRISHTQPGNVKEYYRKFRSDFDARVEDIIQGIDKLNQK